MGPLEGIGLSIQHAGGDIVHILRWYVGQGPRRTAARHASVAVACPPLVFSLKLATTALHPWRHRGAPHTLCPLPNTGALFTQVHWRCWRKQPGAEELCALYSGRRSFGDCVDGALDCWTRAGFPPTALPHPVRGCCVLPPPLPTPFSPARITKASMCVRPCRMGQVRVHTCRWAAAMAWPGGTLSQLWRPHVWCSCRTSCVPYLRGHTSTP
jgi:hypothetical protein